MKKIFCTTIVTLLFLFTLSAQNNDSTKSEPKPKKESGFMKFVKKSVESTTGIDVSKETLFVYPTIGEYKMGLVSCKGDKETGIVKFVFNISWFGKNKFQAQPVIKEVYYNKAKQDVIKGHYAHKHHNITATPLAVEFMDILVGVPTDVVNIERLIFSINYTVAGSFEARDIPITWE